MTCLFYFSSLSIRLKPPGPYEEKDEEGTKYLAIKPIAISLHEGLLIWLCYEKNDGIVFKLDKRATIYATNVKNLPRGLTKKQVPPICRSSVDEIIEEGYMSVHKFLC